MSDNLTIITAKADELRRRHDSLKDALRPFNDNKPNLNDSEWRTADSLLTQLDEVRHELAQCEARQQELTDHKDRAGNARRAPVAGLHGHKGTSPARAAVLRNIDEYRFLPDAARDAAVKMIEDRDAGEQIARGSVNISSPAYFSAFTKWMRDPERGHLEWTDVERSAFVAVREEQRAMSVGTNSAGGFAVPFVLDPAFAITGAGSINPMRKIATIKNVPAGNYHAITAGQVSFSWDTEASAVSDDSPTLTQPSIPSYLARGYIPASFEAFTDIPDLASEVMKLLADGKDNLEAAAHWTGSGTGQPKGAVTAVGAVAGSRVSPATGGTIALADGFTVQNALPARYSARASWASSITVINKLRQLAMAQNSANSVWTDMGDGQPAGFLGRPYYEAASMTASITTGQDVLLYGDFSRYYICDVGGVGATTVEFLPNLLDQATGRPSGQRGFLMWFRQGGDLVDGADGLRVLRL